MPKSMCILACSGAQNFREGEKEELQRREQVKCVALPDMIGGKGQLANLLDSKGIISYEIPCIAFERTKAPLSQILTQEEWEMVLMSAPEAATIVRSAWCEAAKPDIPFACVGEKTRNILLDAAIATAYHPPSSFSHPPSSGKELIARLPGPQTSGRVLLPVSARARGDTEDRLRARGYSVERIDTYDTVAVPWTKENCDAAAASAVVALASPSAIEEWVRRVGNDQRAVCFGGRSADACTRAGFASVSVSASPDIQGWADAIEDALNG
mmetsp:Transcript_24433/g.35479  ORF Transcript_24433/g.35479 Transcript_24433/m.35479 type:complete len:269 (-) Transcript_24433:1362-2168(-)